MSDKKADELVLDAAAAEMKEQVWTQGDVMVAILAELTSSVNGLLECVHEVYVCAGLNHARDRLRAFNPDQSNYIGVAQYLIGDIDKAVAAISGIIPVIDADIFNKSGVIDEERSRLRQMSLAVLAMNAYGEAGLVQNPTAWLSHHLDNMVNAAASNLVYLQNPSPKGIVPDEIPF